MAPQLKRAPFVVVMPVAAAALPITASLLISIALAGCPKAHVDAHVDPKLAAVTAALDKRFGAIKDISIAGTAAQGAETSPFTYEMKQPQFVRATLGPHSFTFDGKALLVRDDDAKVAQRKDLAGVDEPTRLLMLHQAFSRFACEGWRPPLIRPTGAHVDDAAGRWTVVVPIDDSELKEERLVLKQGTADFVEKSIVNKAGAPVTSTKVTAELVDPTTKMTFPKAWETTGGDGNGLKMSIDKAVVNGGLDAARFNTDVPAGYKTTP